MVAEALRASSCNLAVGAVGTAATTGEELGAPTATVTGPGGALGGESGADPRPERALADSAESLANLVTGRRNTLAQ